MWPPFVLVLVFVRCPASASFLARWLVGCSVEFLALNNPLEAPFKKPTLASGLMFPCFDCATLDFLLYTLCDTMDLAI